MRGKFVGYKIVGKGRKGRKIREERVGKGGESGVGTENGRETGRLEWKRGKKNYRRKG